MSTKEIIEGLQRERRKLLVIKQSSQKFNMRNELNLMTVREKIREYKNSIKKTNNKNK